MQYHMLYMLPFPGITNTLDTEQQHRTGWDRGMPVKLLASVVDQMREVETKTGIMMIFLCAFE